MVDAVFMDEKSSGRGGKAVAAMSSDDVEALIR